MNKVKVAVIVFFALILGAGIWLSSSKDGGAISLKSKTIVKGVITSEKENFFKDPRVKEIFEKNGLDVQFSRMASGKIAQAKTPEELSGADFVFPPGIQTSEKVKSNFPSAQAYNIFYSPMIIATWTPIVDILAANGLMKKVGNYDALDIESFMKLVQNNVRWKDMKHSEAYPVNKIALIYSSDSRYSNAAKMYLALNSYVLNGNNVVTTELQSETVMPILTQIVQAQGSRESSSTNMMSDYMSIGRGKVPMMFAYESEFLEQAFKNNGLGKDMKLIYPTPTVFTKHVMVALNPKAQPLVELFKSNSDLRKIAAEYGFRMENDSSIVAKAKSVNISIPDVVVDVIDPPSFDILEHMADSVEKK